jgi:spore germination cell wall hydrolase CwlJ-like protein
MRVITLLILGALYPLQSMASSIDEEIRCLALNIYFEARGETHEGQLAVGYVTMNRVVHARYPNNVCGVVWQRKQFSWTHDGRSDRPRDERAWAHAQRIASYIYKNYFTFMHLTKGATDLTRGAIFYYAPKKVKPKWASEMIKTAQIGGHLFMKENS